MARFNLSPPWIIFYKEVSALFEKDPEVNVVYHNENYEIKLYVDNQEKAEAITKLLPATKTFGNVVLKITVVPANKTGESKIDLFRKAFEGNEAVSFISSIDGILSNPINYVVFVKEVIQYYTDDLSDAYGMRSTLYQDIAKDVFGEQEGIFFCTDIN